MTEPELKYSDVLAKARTDLAVERTGLAMERSLMAWMRTAVSLIGFGFTLFSFLNSLRDKGLTSAMRDTAPRDVGLFLVVLGVLAALFGAIDYLRSMKGLKKTFEQATVKWFPVIAITLIALLGITLILKIAL